MVQQEIQIIIINIDSLLWAMCLSSTYKSRKPSCLNSLLLQTATNLTSSTELTVTVELKTCVTAAE